VTITLSKKKDSVISGWVVNPKGQPVDGKVTALADDNQKLVSVPPMTYTDHDGAFVLTGVAPGNYTLVVNVDGAGQKPLHTVRIDGSQHITGLRLVYPAGDLSISGRVTDKEGHPVRAAIQIMREEANGAFPQGSERTRADGTYEFSNLEEGTYTLMLQGEATIGEMRPGVPAGSTDVDFVVEGQPRISGRVADPQGKPITRYDIAAVMLGRGAQFQPVFQPVASGDGAFELTVDSGSYELLVRAEGYQMTRQGGFNLDPGEHIDDVAITLKPGDSTARGVVKDAAGQPVADAHIFSDGLPPRPERALDGSRTQSANDGSFTVDVVPSEAAEIGAYHPKAGRGSGWYDPDNPRQVITIVLQGVGTVTGTVRVGGAPAPHHVVQLIDSAGNRQQALTRQDGQYSFEGLQPGQVTVNVEIGPGGALPEESADAATQDAIVASGGTTQVDFDL
ncbi:MAG: carboxypeptidase regulatory-like domain-containing protein, partial [Candidatus Hydrogenedentes bacterium]|nr:carboxypeptidase regulatory-like domain-containing protein [Candidatus Hydrogenedentota bacterium]